MFPLVLKNAASEILLFLAMSWHKNDVKWITVLKMEQQIFLLISKAKTHKYSRKLVLSPPLVKGDSSNFAL